MIAAGVLLIAPHALAQPAAAPIVGILATGPQSVFQELPTYARFRARMRELGWRDGENIRYLGRGVGGDLAKLDVYMQEFVRARVALVVAVASEEALAAKRATATMPIVMVHPSNPVDLGLVASLNRPGGNITGTFAQPLGGKSVELLMEIFPTTKRIIGSYDPPWSDAKYESAMKKVASNFGITIVPAELPAGGDYDSWVAKARREGATAALISHAASVYRPARREALAKALIKYRLPAMCGTGEYVDSGCLASYSASNIELYASAAVFVDKILRGAKPGDLPIEQPSKYELVVNQKTAKALGITLPPSIIFRADRVIE